MGARGVQNWAVFDSRLGGEEDELVEKLLPTMILYLSVIGSINTMMAKKANTAVMLHTDASVYLTIACYILTPA